MVTKPKAEAKAEQLAGLKKEHERLTALEEAAGILTGDVAMSRNERAQVIEQLEREARNGLSIRAGYPLQGEREVGKN